MNAANVTKTSTILTTTTGLIGTFGTPTFTGLPTQNLTGSVNNVGNNVVVDLALNFVGASTTNQQAVGGALTNYFNRTGSIPTVFATMSPSALTQASGEVATGSQQAAFNSMGLFFGAMLDPFAPGRQGGVAGGGALGFAPDRAGGGLPPEAALAYSKAMPGDMPVQASDAQGSYPARLIDQRWGVWGAAYGGNASVDGNTSTGSASTTTKAMGIAAGADYRVTGDTTIGFAMAGGNTSWSLDGGLGSGKSDVFQIGAYGTTRSGPAYVSAAMAYAWHQMSTTRTVTIAGTDTLAANFHPNVFGGRIETGYRFGVYNLGLTPYLAFQAQMAKMPNYSETATTGNNTFALSFADKTETATRTELGLGLDSRFTMGYGNALLMNARVAYAYDTNTSRTINPTFQALPGASFTVNGAAPASSLLLASASAEYRMHNNWSLQGKVGGEFGSGTQNLSATGGLRYAW